jgi:hypothetical protein
MPGASNVKRPAVSGGGAAGRFCPAVAERGVLALQVLSTRRFDARSARRVNSLLLRRFVLLLVDRLHGLVLSKGCDEHLRNVEVGGSIPLTSAAAPLFEPPNWTTSRVGTRELVCSICQLAESHQLRPGHTSI